jgi:hypothetical protein
MIIAKINPALTIATQQNLFNSTVEYITGSYMAATANQYALGADKVNFRIAYGNCQFDETGKAISFTPIHSEGIQLEQADIENWGTDDAVIYEVIADKKGIEVVETVEANIDRFGF